MSRASIVSKCKKDILDIYSYAVNAVKPEHLIKTRVSFIDNKLAIKDYGNQNNEITLDRSSLHVIGGGKSVLGMAKGLAEKAKQENVTHLFSNGTLSLPIGLESSLNDQDTSELLKSIGIKCLFGSDCNLPDYNSVKASQAILDSITNACLEDKVEERQPIFIVLISGGGSACLTKPRHIDLNKKLEITKFLVQNGANIITLNKVRRYFSSIKAGQLADHILKCNPRSQILTLILSDVIGDRIEFIASGPTFLSSDDSELDLRQSMIKVLTEYGYPNIEELSAFNPSPKPRILNIDYEAAVKNHIVGNNKLALDAAISRASQLGYKVKCLGNKLEGSSGQVLKEILDNCHDTLVGEKGSKILVLAGGEATIDKLEGETWGKGGRAQEMALDYIISKIAEKSEDRSNLVDLFLAAGTDGQDGPTEMAGCLASFSEHQLSPCFSLDDARRAKISHDSYNFWSRYKPEWLIKTGLTGTNVMDLYMSLVQRDESSR